MNRDYLPTSDDVLLVWLNNASSKITATPTAFGLTAPLGTTFAGLVSTFSGLVTTYQNPDTRTHPNILLRNAARTSVKAYARMLARIVQATPTVTDAQKASLGLTVRANPSPINPPTTPPVLEVVSSFGRRLNIKLHGVDTSRRGKPAGIAGASLFSFVGDAPPADISLYKFEANVTVTNFTMEFPSTVAAGAQVWLTSFWYSPRAQSGPACFPISTFLGGGVVAATEEAA